MAKSDDAELVPTSSGHFASSPTAESPSADSIWDDEEGDFYSSIVCPRCGEDSGQCLSLGDGTWICSNRE
jgi:hypothetical protein